MIKNLQKKLFHQADLLFHHLVFLEVLLSFECPVLAVTIKFQVESATKLN